MSLGVGNFSNPIVLRANAYLKNCLKRAFHFNDDDFNHHH